MTINSFIADEGAAKGPSAFKRTAILTATFLAVVGLSLGVMGVGGAHADPNIPGDPDFLGNADSYAVIASSTITNTGPTVITGDVALTPGTSVTGFGGAPDATVTGSTDVANGAALNAHDDLVAAYTVLSNLVPTNDLGPALVDLTGSSLVAGTYRAGSLALTGNLTLDGAGNVDAVWVFQADSSLTTANGSTVTLIGGAQACNVYWKVGSSATLNGGSGGATLFVGTILADASISVGDEVTIDGRLLASAGAAGAVTLIDDVITTPTTCTVAVSTLSSGSGGTGGSGGSGGSGPTNGLASTGLLANTGSDSAPIGILGLLVILLGSGAVLFARRLDREAAE
ncbi:MAG: hypothetical protein JWP19_2278 [Rhodoglobus sp.]|nr:hypothetical protein [Rhodoglobus sp.]